MTDRCLTDLMNLGLFHLSSTNEQIEAAVPPESTPGHHIVISTWTFSDWWAQCGFPRVVLSHRHAAALMATRTSPEALDEVPVPWQAFAIDVPDGLVEFTNTDENGTEVYQITHAFVMVYEEIATLLFGDRTKVRACVLAQGVRNLGSFEHESPAAELICRLALGACLEMTTHRPAGSPAFERKAIKRNRQGLPETWTFQLTRDVKVDCRAAVKSFSRGESKSSPVVQSLVRGHWKHQAHGALRAERKWIFVEPYWRGPEDAPIAVRKHRFGGGHGSPPPT